MAMLMRVTSGLQQLVRRAPAVRGLRLPRSVRPYIEDERHGAVDCIICRCRCHSQYPVERAGVAGGLGLFGRRVDDAAGTNACQCRDVFEDSYPLPTGDLTWLPLFKRKNLLTRESISGVPTCPEKF